MKFFNLHTHKATNSNSVLELVNQYPWKFIENIPHFSIGIHPWYIDLNRIERDLEIIEQKLQTKNCLALGECGLDKRIEIDFDLQIKVFESQLKLAQKYQKPVIIHCVSAFQELIEIKNRLQISVPIIIHGFSKNQILANQLIANGFYLSFGKYLFLNPDLEFVFKNSPLEKIFLETDTISQNIEEVYNLAAKFKKTTVSVLQKQININFETVFNFKIS